MATGDRIEAWLAYDPDPAKSAIDILGFASADPSRDAVWARLLVGALASSRQRRLVMSQVDVAELDFGILFAVGFREGARTMLFSRVTSR
jgi:hypothetical protein